MNNDAITIINMSGQDRVCTIISNNIISHISYKNIDELSNDIMYRTCVIKSYENQDQLASLEMLQNIKIYIDTNYKEFYQKLKEKGLEVDYLQLSNINEIFPRQSNLEINIKH